MGYIEDLANREQARQEANAAKAAEAARVMNQGTPSVGLAGVVAEPYNRGVSAEDLYKMEMAKRASEQNAIMDMINKNRAYQENRGAGEQYDRASKYVPFDDGVMGDDAKHDEYLNALSTKAAREQEYLNKVDPGLAAKWMQSYKGR